jgi:quercetin dioxygenase-like cupin family protein
MRIVACSTAIAVLVIGTLFSPARAEDKMVHNTLATSKFANFPGLPTCTMGAVQSGDPSSGASVILVKATSGCVVPWHWHTPTEQLMIVSGRAKAEMKDGSPAAVHAGDYLSMPSKSPHQFTCVTACTFFVASDAAFDIHYVDASGNEIPAEQALKKSSKMPAKKPAPKSE